jgi:hypothetical protein
MRDLVYHHLWDKSTITSFPGLSMVAGGASCIDDVCHCSVPHKNLRLPHFVMPDFMGKATAREIVRALYEAFQYTEEHLIVRVPEYIKSTVTKDVFRVGLSPGSHLRSLVVRIKLDRIRSPHPRYLPWNPHIVNKRYTEKDMLKKWLKTLLYIQGKARFELRVVLFQRNIRVAVIDEVLEVMDDTRQALLNRHVKVTVDWIYRGYWTRGKKACSGQSLVRNMDDYFTLARKTWKVNLMTFLYTVSMLKNATNSANKHRHMLRERSGTNTPDLRMSLANMFQTWSSCKRCGTVTSTIVQRMERRKTRSLKKHSRLERRMVMTNMEMTTLVTGLTGVLQMT